MRAGLQPDERSGLPDAVVALLRRALDLLGSPPHPRASSLAITLCQRALAETGYLPTVSSVLARALHVHGRSEDAVAVCGRALALHPEAVELRLEQLLHTIPVFYREPRQVELAREAYTARLGALERHLSTAPSEELARLFRRARFLSPYWLPYQGLVDASLYRRLGALVHRARLAAHPDDGGEPAMHGLSGALRVGFVSNHFHSHTTWHVVIRGWIAGLRARGFACHGYSLGTFADTCTDDARRDCVRFLHGERPFREWCEAIRADRLHALIFPGLAFSPTLDRLAHMRLAPVQCVSFAYCDTSGSPNMDYFLSSGLMEPGGGDAHYTEQLVRLPDLAFSYPGARVDPSARGREHPGIRHGTVLYLSPHLPRKYLPQHDDLYARIAAGVPESQVVFVRDPRVEAVSRLLERRLRGAFEARGVDPARHLVFLDRLDREDYESLLVSADAYLDVPGWNGGTMTAEALVRNLPVVTIEGAIARSRMGAAMLRHLDVTDTIAFTADDYVRLAIRLGHDVAWRESLRRRLAVTSHRVHDDTARVDGLAAFLERAIHHAAGAGSSSVPR